MLENAVRICDAKFGNIYRWDGDALHLVATHNTPPAFAEARRRSPLRPDPEIRCRSHGSDQNGVHVADVAAEQDYIEAQSGDCCRRRTWGRTDDSWLFRC